MILASSSSVVASLLALVSMLWQHIASVAAATIAQDMAYGTLQSHIGLSAMAVGWAGVALLILVSIELLALKSSLPSLINLRKE